MKHTITVLLLSLAMNLNAQITFEKKHQFADLEYAEGHFVAQTYDNGYFVAGDADIPGDTGRIHLLRTDLYGDTLWQSIFGLFDRSQFSCAALTSDSGMILVGSNSYPVGPDDHNELYIIKIDKNGDTLWTRQDSSIYPFGNLIQQTFDGGYILTASNDSNGNRDIMLLRLNASGSIQWTRIIPSAHVEDADFLIQTSDNGFAITGYQYSANGDSTEAMILKTDSSGATIWKKYYSSSSHLDGKGIVQTSDGNLVVAIEHEIDSANNDNLELIKVDIIVGDTIWIRTLGNIIEDENLHHLALCSDDGFLLTGSIDDTILFILRVDPSGDTVWTKRILYAEGEWSQQTNDNGFIITGSDNGNGPNDFLYMLKLDSAGNFSTAISENENSFPFLLYPNPSSSTFTIRTEDGFRNTHVEIYDLIGKKVFSSAFRERLTVNVEDLLKGIYFVRLVGDERQSIQKMIVK